MKLKQRVLTKFDRIRLSECVIKFELDFDCDKRSSESMRKILSNKRRVTTDYLLTRLSEPEVKDICSQVGISVIGRKSVLIDRLQLKDDESVNDSINEIDFSNEKECIADSKFYLSRQEIKRKLIEAMEIVTLRNIIKEYDLSDEVIDGRKRDDLKKIISRKRRIYPEELLAEMRETEIKYACEILGMNSIGRRAYLIDQIHDYLEVENVGDNFSKKTPSKKKQHDQFDSINVLSTRNAKGNIKTYGFKFLEDIIQQIDGNHSTICIATAYYDTSFLLKLIKNRTSKIRIVIQALGGRRLATQIDELEKITLNRNVEIQLVSSYTLFHTKLFLFRSPTKQYGIIGSANATTNAHDGTNEECVVQLSQINDLEFYFEEIWKNESISLKDARNEKKIKNLINFFRTGVLYYKPTHSVSTTYNPFNTLFLKLSTSQKQSLTSNIKLRNSSKTSEAFPAFSLKAALKINDDDSHIERVLRLKRLAVQTCLGQWVPSQYADQVDIDIEKKSKSTRKKWLDFKNLLNNNIVEKAYKDYITDVEELFNNVDIPLQKEWSKHKKNLDYGYQDLELFESFILRLKNRLDDDDFLKRLSQPLIAEVMPEIWGDTVVTTEFQETFFESVTALISSNQTRKNSLVAKSIMTKFQDLSEIDSGEQAASFFIKNLKKNGWQNNDWCKP
ncbi:phospholipase D-like domain-containing protein [Ampullimonas aquatilis]|uniref:phospholipase D-like domain-containing protein n=1 Tax=Ampullimonas aquatilis TaxID=1341549 RepID=UPI003C760B39